MKTGSSDLIKKKLPRRRGGEESNPYHKLKRGREIFSILLDFVGVISQIMSYIHDVAL